MTDLFSQVVSKGWSISPLATAVRLSALDRERYIPAPHLKIISDAIVDSVTKLDPRFPVISMPPRHGKSWLISRYAPTWYLKNWPHKKVMITGYGSDFAKSWGRLTRNDAIRHQELLGFEVAKDSKAAETWHTDQGGGVVTAGIGSGITGKGADLLIIDDPIKNAKEAFSSSYREDVWDWYQTTARTRLHKGGTIVIVMTRWHDDDFAGRALSDEFSDPTQFREIRLPAIAMNDEDVLGRKKGQALWPAKYDLKALEAIKDSVNDETWHALYQQTPINTTGLGAVYYAYSDVQNVAKVERDPTLPLVWSMDFNLNPMSSVICQYRRETSRHAILSSEDLISVEVLKELCLPNSNTPQACRVFHETVVSRGWLTSGPLAVEVYGDATGSRGHTNGGPSDWEIVRQFFAEHRSHYKVSYHVETGNPAVRDRTNAMNRALRSAGGTCRMIVDESCRELRKDLLEVIWKKDSAGNMLAEIDKSDPKRTHASDSLGYFIYRKFRIAPKSGAKPGIMR